MTRIEFAPEIADDFERILEHLLEHQSTAVTARMEDIIRAIDVLAFNPLIGRLVRADLRELVIGQQSRGYVALYRYIAEIDTVVILAIRAQQEAGYGEA